LADIHSRVGENREGRMETKGAASRTRRDDPVRVGAVALTFALAAAGYLALSFIRLDGLGGTSGVRIGLQPTTVATATVALLSFSALVLPGALLALQGRGRLSALPGPSYFGASVIIPLLRGWGGLGPFSWFLLYPAASLVLVALPPIVLAARVGRRPGRRLDRADAGALVVCLAVAGMVLFAWGIVEERVLPSTLEDRGLIPLVETSAACFLFGLLAGRSRPGWPWAPLLVPTLLVGWHLARLTLALGSPGGPWPPVTDLLALPLAPAVLVTLAGSRWWPLGERLREDPRTSALFLLIVVNGLNAADAVLTEVGVRFGQAAELNPVASGIGTAGKLAVVGAASYLIYRIRPRALLWPAVALAAVILYHAAGAVFDL